MSFQKCPVCDGTGKAVVIETLYQKFTEPCPTCHGARIIDEQTGLPPKYGNLMPIGNGCVIVVPEDKE